MTASRASNSSKSSRFDESDTDDAEHILTRNSMGRAFARALEGTNSSLEEGMAYTPVHKLSTAINSTKHISH